MFHKVQIANFCREKVELQTMAENRLVAYVQNILAPPVYYIIIIYVYWIEF